MISNGIFTLPLVQIIIVACLVIIPIAMLILAVEVSKAMMNINKVFEDLHKNNLSLAQLLYANSLNLKTMAENSAEMTDELEGLKVVTEAIGYEDMDIYEDFKKEGE